MYRCCCATSQFDCVQLLLLLKVRYLFFLSSLHLSVVVTSVQLSVVAASVQLFVAVPIVQLQAVVARYYTIVVTQLSFLLKCRYLLSCLVYIPLF